MKFNSKKNFFAAAAAFAANVLVPFALWAIPASAAEIRDASGEYVYYRDYSFNRESYIGFLYYDDSTYEARYYAPAREKLIPKNIDILFSVDSGKNKMELTGERFIVPPEQDDIEIVNYIHDLIYELSARRAKLDKSALVDWTKNFGAFMEAGIRAEENYEQFGGTVQMIYDASIPIFNLKKIVDHSGQDVFAAVAIGAIENSNDASFSQFVPATSFRVAEKGSQIKSAKKETLGVRAEIGKSGALVQKAQADKNWALAGQSVWTLGDSAIISLQSLALPNEDKFATALTSARLVRLFASSKNFSYCDLSTLQIHADVGRLKTSAQNYNPKTKKAITDIKILSAALPNFCGCFSLAVYSGDYQANRGYFDKIAKSYSCKLER